MDHPPNSPHQLQSPAKTLYYRNLIIFLLSLAFIVHTLFFTLADLLFPLFFQFSYPISLFVFPLLSNIIINSFTVSITHHLWASLSMYPYNALFLGHLVVIVAAVNTNSTALLLFATCDSLFLLLTTDDVWLWRFMGPVFEHVVSAVAAAMKNSSRAIWVVNGIFMYLFMGAHCFPN